MTIFIILGCLFFFLWTYLYFFSILMKCGLLGLRSLCILLGFMIICIDVGCLIVIVHVLVDCAYLIICVPFICTSFYLFLWRLASKCVSSGLDCLSTWIFESAWLLFRLFCGLRRNDIILFISADWFRII